MVLPMILSANAGEELEVARGHLHVRARLRNGLPLSRLSSSPVLRRDRAAPAHALHDAPAFGRRHPAPRLASNAACAVSTARIDVRLRRLGTVASTSPVDGLILSKVPPSEPRPVRH
jgi:hypothetical protein